MYSYETLKILTYSIIAINNIVIRPRQIGWILEPDPNSNFIKDLGIKRNSVVQSSEVQAAIVANKGIETETPCKDQTIKAWGDGRRRGYGYINI